MGVKMQKNLLWALIKIIIKSFPEVMYYRNDSSETSRLQSNFRSNSWQYFRKKLVTFCLHGTNIWCSPDELHKWAEIKMQLERSSSDSLDEMALALWQGSETKAEMVVLKYGQS